VLKINRVIPGDKIKLLVFDLDGTLVDSRVDLANGVNAMLRHYGESELPVDVVASFIGDGAGMLVRRALGDPEDENLVLGALEYFVAYYRGHLLDNTYVYPGTVEALDTLRNGSNGLDRKMAVLSNKPVFPSRKIVDGLGLSRYFFQVYGGNSFPTKKPDPLGALKLCEEAGVSPHEAVIIGDSNNDVLAGRNSGMYTIGLTYGLAPHTLEFSPPDVLVDSPQELTQAFEEIEMPESDE
jgi:phosphoglycolate phosphatase